MDFETQDINLEKVRRLDPQCQHILRVEVNRMLRRELIIRKLKRLRRENG